MNTDEAARESRLREHIEQVCFFSHGFFMKIDFTGGVCVFCFFCHEFFMKTDFTGGVCIFSYIFLSKVGVQPIKQATYREHVIYDIVGIFVMRTLNDTRITSYI